jgi:Tfp pilus assembly protein PilN
MSIVNLLPDDYLLKRLQARANYICIGLFAVVMIGVAAASLVSDRSNRNTKTVLDRVNSDYVEAARQLEEMRKLEATKRQMVAKAGATGALVERVPRSYLLAMLTQALPADTSLLKVELKPGKVLAVTASPKGSKFDAVKKKTEPTAAPQPAGPPVVLEVSGLAATDVDVATFITNLKVSPVLASVDLNYSQDKLLDAGDKDSPKLHVREFKVLLEVRPDVDVIDLIRDAPKSEGLSAAAVEPVEGAQS